MSTTNLQLETIELTDNMQTSLLNKMNNNFNKIDEAYEKLKEGLLNQTGKETLSEAIEYVDDLANEKSLLLSSLEEITSLGNATETDIKSGKTALVQGIEVTGTAFSEVTTATAEDIAPNKTAYDNDGNLIIGTMKGMPTINIEAISSSSVQASILSGYGAGIDNNGTLVIWAMTTDANYENVSFTYTSTSISAGTLGRGFGITAFNASNPMNVPHACTITGLGGYNIINVTLTTKSVSTTYDYVSVQVDITAE